MLPLVKLPSAVDATDVFIAAAPLQPLTSLLSLLPLTVPLGVPAFVNAADAGFDADTAVVDDAVATADLAPTAVDDTANAPHSKAARRGRQQRRPFDQQTDPHAWSTESRR